MSTDNKIEQEIKAVGADVAPRITPADIEANIASEHYFTAAAGADSDEGVNTFHIKSDLANDPLELLTFCVLVLKNGFTVTGESACASPENFNAEIGRKIARDKAIDKVWPLLGFRLRDRLSAAPLQAKQSAPGLALDSGEFIPAANIPHHPV